MAQSTKHAHSTQQSIKKHPYRFPCLRNHRWVLLIMILTIVPVGVLLLFDFNDEPVSINPENLRAIGPESAPVIITEYADFGCITCKTWHLLGVREQILERYGDQIRFVWRDFPVTTPQSPRVAEAGFCAQDQEAFWAYHSILYANAPKFNDQDLISYAAEIGLDTLRFTTCLASGEHQGSVDQERSSALELGLRSVPSFLVNDRRLIGTPSFDQLVFIIDEILASAD